MYGWLALEITSKGVHLYHSKTLKSWRKHYSVTSLYALITSSTHCYLALATIDHSC